MTCDPAFYVCNLHNHARTDQQFAFLIEVKTFDFDVANANYPSKSPKHHTRHEVSLKKIRVMMFYPDSLKNQIHLPVEFDIKLANTAT